MPQERTNPAATKVLQYERPLAGPILRSDDASLRSVVTSLWTLGGLYLAGGGLLAGYLLAYRGVSTRPVAAAGGAIIPGVLFLVFASGAQRQSAWAIRAAIVCNFMAMFSWLVPLFLVVKYVGWIDLIELKQFIGDAAALFMLILLAYHLRTLLYLGKVARSERH